MSVLTQDFEPMAAGRPVNKRDVLQCHSVEAAQMTTRCIHVVLAVVMTALALWFVYSVIFVFRTGYVGIPF
jgi:heme/copper-type cytochrome/quinol oxidase subunit 4